MIPEVVELWRSRTVFRYSRVSSIVTELTGSEQNGPISSACGKDEDLRSKYCSCLEEMETEHAMYIDAVMSSKSEIEKYSIFLLAFNY